RHIEARKGVGQFVTEVSMDETDTPQTPVEMLIILAAIADEGIPAQTIAPKFSGRFKKGVDYAGDVSQFAREFEQDLAVIRFATEQFPLPANLKLPPGVFQSREATPAFPPQKKIDRTMPNGLVIM
ncbi:MAG: tagaturonate epimerase family protein, partial [Verrucomicrobia bacterium]|nr:tagaturonate epimerase family protein [Verrucomicrobiota bacterium]